jgi:hypothetical protein
MDKLRSMEVFVTVADCGSFTQAAGQLTLSAVMVGKYISALEEQLGARLVERNTRRQSLTDAGRVYYEEAPGCLSRCTWRIPPLNDCVIHPPVRCVSASTTFGSCVVPLRLACVSIRARRTGSEQPTG